jgi:hypothetical protein
MRGYTDFRIHPHPYFVNKILVFFGLRAGFRCKIVKTKELFAKSSSIRSYEPNEALAFVRPIALPLISVHSSEEIICNPGKVALPPGLWTDF